MPDSDERRLNWDEKLLTQSWEGFKAVFPLSIFFTLKDILSEYASRPSAFLIALFGAWLVDFAAYAYARRKPLKYTAMVAAVAAFEFAILKLLVWK